MQATWQTIRFFHTLFCFSLGFFLVLLTSSLFLFFWFDIPHIFHMRTGRFKKKCVHAGGLQKEAARTGHFQKRQMHTKSLQQKAARKTRSCHAEKKCRVLKSAKTENMAVQKNREKTEMLEKEMKEEVHCSKGRGKNSTKRSYPVKEDVCCSKRTEGVERDFKKMGGLKIFSQERTAMLEEDLGKRNSSAACFQAPTGILEESSTHKKWRTAVLTEEIQEPGKCRLGRFEVQKSFLLVHTEEEI